MKSLLIATLVGVAVLALAACAGNGQATPTGDEPGPNVEHTNRPPPPPHVINLNDSGGRDPFRFDPSELTFSAGETVALELRSESQFHTFTVEALGIQVDVDGGETVKLTYTFDQPGTYDLICIPHRAAGMTGTITVR